MLCLHMDAHFAFSLSSHVGTHIVHIELEFNKWFPDGKRRAGLWKFSLNTSSLVLGI